MDQKRQIINEEMLSFQIKKAEKKRKKKKPNGDWTKAALDIAI